MQSERSSGNWVAILDGGYVSYDQEVAILQAAGFEVKVFHGARDDRAAKLRFARGAIGALVRWIELDEQAFKQIPSVRYIVRYGVGFDNIDLEAASCQGVAVCNVQGYANHSVSDHALALLLACVRGLRVGREELTARYGAPPDVATPELRELTMGIVGLGRIGGVFCTKIRPLVREVVACDPYIPAQRFADLGATPQSLEALLARSDAISLHCNLTPETRGLFDEHALNQMRNGAILINTARGPIVDEGALLCALNAGRLSGAGLDVFHDEPPGGPGRALLNHRKVEATGHYAWYSTPAARELQRRAAENMAAMLAGVVPADCLNRAALGG